MDGDSVLLEPLQFLTPFPVYISDVSLIAGKYEYVYTEQAIDESGDFLDADSPRAGTCRELSNKLLTTPFYAVVSFMAIIDGEPLYAFHCCGTTVSPSSSSSGSSFMSSSGSSFGSSSFGSSSGSSFGPSSSSSSASALPCNTGPCSIPATVHATVVCTGGGSRCDWNGTYQLDFTGVDSQGFCVWFKDLNGLCGCCNLGTGLTFGYDSVTTHDYYVGLNYNPFIIICPGVFLGSPTSEACSPLSITFSITLPGSACSPAPFCDIGTCSSVIVTITL